MKEKIAMIKSIFAKDFQQDAGEGLPGIFLNHGTSYGGLYGGRKYMYSAHMIESMPIEKLESFIKKQLALL